MTIDLIWSVVSDQTGPRGIGWLNIALTITDDIKFPMAKGGACFLNERSREVKVGGVLDFIERIVRCSTKFAINDVAAIIGGKFERENIALVRPRDGSVASTEGQQRQKW